jgi:hypothetical protein
MVLLNEVMGLKVVELHPFQTQRLFTSFRKALIAGVGYLLRTEIEANRVFKDEGPARFALFLSLVKLASVRSAVLLFRVPRSSYSPICLCESSLGATGGESPNRSDHVLKDEKRISDIEASVLVDIPDDFLIVRSGIRRHR